MCGTSAVFRGMKPTLTSSLHLQPRPSPLLFPVCGPLPENPSLPAAPRPSCLVLSSTPSQDHTAYKGLQHFLFPRSRFRVQTQEKTPTQTAPPDLPCPTLPSGAPMPPRTHGPRSRSQNLLPWCTTQTQGGILPRIAPPFLMPSRKHLFPNIGTSFSLPHCTVFPDPHLLWGTV